MNHNAKLLELSRSISGLNRACSNEMLKGEGIHFGQPPIFHALLDRDEQSQCDIAANIGVSRASVGVSLRRMEKSGIVKRMINQKDSRYNLVSLTEKGLEMAHRSDEIMLSLSDAKLKGFTEEQKETLIHMLERVEKNLKDLHAENLRKAGKLAASADLDEEE